MKCPCGTGQNFELCCEPFIKGVAKPKTAEALMRSRYSAFATKSTKYLETTLAPESKEDFDIKATREWAEKATWKGLQIISTEKGLEADKKGSVEFIATYEMDGVGTEHHEVSEFKKSDSGDWFFVDGDSHSHSEGEGHCDHHHRSEPLVREGPKVGRNDPCLCGSEKKYKKCCGLNS